ncbi:hypothetical protein Hneap_0685 [Halothiobacillus neapolitanus c2]|uniref:Uncharacterized protein n=1 Tax=Halothiobacillus neapolitanus (strain ATCC 23641 / DSM 15147 / CIP 104769 / NCIMB 8539 / c2) TaxID=555778 RepID=D0KYL3_HALNC|nr:hypothetical protein Hneap_0685 [Halothiobacillus neapolitanus c2]
MGALFQQGIVVAYKVYNMALNPTHLRGVLFVQNSHKKYTAPPVGLAGRWASKE